MRIVNEIMIDAPLDTVWALTLDVERWPEFSPTMTSIERLDDGPLAVGSRARVKQPAQRAKVWTVTRLDPPNTFAWATDALGAHMVGAHQVEAVDGGCRNTLSVEITGRTAWLLSKLAAGRIRAAIASENEGFKRRAEGG